jgi:hypothetical protein
MALRWGLPSSPVLHFGPGPLKSGKAIFYHLTRKNWQVDHCLIERNPLEKSGRKKITRGNNGNIEIEGVVVQGSIWGSLA